MSFSDKERKKIKNTYEKMLLGEINRLVRQTITARNPAAVLY